MTDNHSFPITPPPELVKKWGQESDHDAHIFSQIATKAAQWGADTELKACRMEIIDGPGLFYIDETSDRVRLAEDIWTARRPKPPSLKEQALEQLDGIAAVFRMSHGGNLVCDTIRLALEQLDD
jgi:hypothetical protein